MTNKTTIDNMRTLNIMCVYDKLLKHPEVKANDKFYSLLTALEKGIKDIGVDFVEDIYDHPDSNLQDKKNMVAFAGLFCLYTKKLDLEKDCGGCESISEETKALINDIKKVLV